MADRSTFHAESMPLREDAAIRLERAGAFPDSDLLRLYGFTARDLVDAGQFESAKTWFQRMARALPIAYERQGTEGVYPVAGRIGPFVSDQLRDVLKVFISTPDGIVSKDDVRQIADELMSLSDEKMSSVKGTDWRKR